MENSYLRILPNVNHDTGGHAEYTEQAALSLGAMTAAMVNDYKLPKLRWTRNFNNNTIKACTSGDFPDRVVVYHAISNSTLGRDFRLMRADENGEAYDQNIRAFEKVAI